MKTFLFILTLLAILPSSSMAEENTPIEVSVSAHLGVGTPHGLGGIGLEVTLMDQVRFDIGIGRGLQGNQYALLVSWVPRVVRGFFVGTGWSRGAYRWEEEVGVDCDEACDARDWDHAQWLNLEIGYRHTFASSWSAGPYLGYSFLLNPDDLRCPPNGGQLFALGCGDEGDGEQLMFVGLALAREL